MAERNLDRKCSNFGVPLGSAANTRVVGFLVRRCGQGMVKIRSTRRRACHPVQVGAQSETKAPMRTETKVHELNISV